MRGGHLSRLWLPRFGHCVPIAGSLKGSDATIGTSIDHGTSRGRTLAVRISSQCKTVARAVTVTVSRCPGKIVTPAAGSRRVETECRGDQPEASATHVSLRIMIIRVTVQASHSVTTEPLALAR